MGKPLKKADSGQRGKDRIVCSRVYDNNKVIERTLSVSGGICRAVLPRKHILGSA